MPDGCKAAGIGFFFSLKLGLLPFFFLIIGFSSLFKQWVTDRITQIWLIIPTMLGLLAFRRTINLGLMYK
jgi:hypothetical protein